MHVDDILRAIDSSSDGNISEIEFIAIVVLVWILIVVR